MDYSLLFTNTLLDYIEASGDQETGHDLYAIAEKQFHLALRRVGKDFIYEVPVPKDLLGGGEWHFIDCEFVEPSRAEPQSFEARVFTLRELNLDRSLSSPIPSK